MVLLVNCLDVVELVGRWTRVHLIGDFLFVSMEGFLDAGGRFVFVFAVFLVMSPLLRKWRKRAEFTPQSIGGVLKLGEQVLKCMRSLGGFAFVFGRVAALFRLLLAGSLLWF